MINTDIVYAKVGNIHNCLRRIRDVTKLNADRLVDIDVQDIFVFGAKYQGPALALGLGRPGTLRA